MKNFLAALMVTLLVLSMPIVSFSESENKDYKNDEITEFISIKDEFDSMFLLKEKERINIQSVENSLLQEFESQSDAISKIKNRCENVLINLEEYYGFDNLSDENWKEYQEALYRILDDEFASFRVSESDYEYGYRFLRAFFDIYENKEKNETVKEALSLGLDKVISVEGEEKATNEVIAENLPYDSPYSVGYWKLISISDLELNYDIIEEKSVDKTRESINLEPAIEYATNHATNPNEDSYYYFSRGDCTNFVSQILEVSGVQQEVYDSVYSGWWHKYNPNAWFNKHTHSRSWTMADTFARYMGVVLTRNNHRNFSANVYAGSIIGADWTDDGDWEHMAFVTQADNYVGSYGYYDYKVAQHTRNHHKWTSNSENNWEYVGMDGGRYGRIRD